MLDPRSLANTIVEESLRRGRPVTNLSLQKIMYFVHGRYLLENGEPLISGSFEAWKYGPVNLPAYEAFKKFGSIAITSLAEKKDIRTGNVTIVPFPSNPTLQQKIIDLATPYLQLSAGRLVELSHASGSPWDRATAGRSERVFGLRITNRSIEEYFRFHKISINAEPRPGEPNEESPPD